jgi:predicted nucleotidyltransferase
MTYHRIHLSGSEIAAFCQRHHVRRLSLFGSVLTPDFDADSDVDVLVEFETGQTPGLEFFSMQDELSQLLGRQADLHTPASLSPHFRDAVLATAQVQYDAA